VVLVLLGGALVKISWTDLYLRYVKPGNRGYLLAAGAVILALAAVSLLRDAWAAWSARPRPSESGTVRLRTAEQHHPGPYSPWLLVLPVLAIFLVAPPALGSDSVQRSTAANSLSSASGSGAASFPPLPAGDAPELRLSDFVARAVWEPTPSELLGRDVTLTGFVVRRSGSVQLARLVITCCAADARPMAIRLTDAPDVPSGTWLRVRARLLPGSATPAEGYLPNVSVLDAATIPEPAEAYEY
jgi:uncharacterized repeat protein (TIGR03943 family)